MKTIRNLSILICSFAIFSCSGGDQMLTVINPDGSCSRVFSDCADSSFMVGDTAKSNPFPVKIDSTWKVSWSYITPNIRTEWPLKTWKWDTAHKKDVIHIYLKKDFKSVDEMDKSFRLAEHHKWHKIVPSHQLEKKFRWFYTYFTYREDYPKIKTLDRIPIDKYLTQGEAEFWFNGNLNYVKGMNGLEINDESKKIEEKYNLWFGHNIWELEYEMLLNKYDSVPHLNITKERLVQAKDSILEKNKDKIRIMEDFDFAKCLDVYFKTNVFSRYSESNGNIFKKFEGAFQDQEFMKYFEGSFDYRLVMPGKLLKYSSATVHGDTLFFNLTAYRMVYSDYEISATSCKANIWAFVVTGIIVLLAMGSWFLGRK